MANIEWFNDYDRGLNCAREEGKLLFLDFFKEG
jgi:hypothetical protein